MKAGLSPSLLSRKTICPAFVPAPFDLASRLRFQAFHSAAMLRVIKRHLRLGFILRAIEARNGNGFRNDLSFEDSCGRLRVVEVKSAKQLAEVHAIQAALYWTPNCEIVVSNGDEDRVLSEDYVRAVQNQAQATCQLLREHPEVAGSTFNPVPEVCRACANEHCPFLPHKQGFIQRPFLIVMTFVFFCMPLDVATFRGAFGCRPKAGRVIKFRDI